ncbi:Putative Mce family protein [Mycobacteroides abscessus subsp. massiliense]|nr:Putative Mce family protein [Mycobacteroides abscessus subsp. massiliense]
MPIGKVTKITSRGTYMEVEFTVDSKVKVPADAKAVTVSTSILTDRHIELTPVYRGGPTLKNGDIIGLDRTKTPVEFDRVRVPGLWRTSSTTAPTRCPGTAS